jgi:hypothetical protein
MWCDITSNCSGYGIVMFVAAFKGIDLLCQPVETDLEERAVSILLPDEIRITTIFKIFCCITILNCCLMYVQRKRDLYFCCIF